MRQVVMGVLALALSVSLTACGGGASGSYETQDVQAMADAGAFSETLEEIDGDTAFSMLYRLDGYGLTRENLTDCAILRSAGAACEEGAVLVLDSEEHAKTVKGALEDYIQKRIDENEDYPLYADAIPKLKDAYVDVKGNTVLLVVANDLDAAKKAVA